MKAARSALLLWLTALILSPTAAAQAIVRLATTTSTDNSGLLQVLLPPFERQGGYRVQVIAVGTGKALRLAENGDVDVVIVHALAAEQQFVEAGYGVNRRDFMYNDFIVLGPPQDPAAIRGLRDVGAAFKRLAQKQAVFVSRGDESGTHKKELSLWAAAGIVPDGRWYRAAGQGMGKVLQIAGEMQAYTLADRGTWLALRAKLPLEVLVEGDPRLFNPYGIIAVNPARHPQANYAGAMALIAWVTSVEGQAIIRDFKIAERALFVPTAGETARRPAP
jgi:tungstate transport system substrate-binding protein